MKKLLIPLACLCVLMGTGLWLLVRRNPVAVPQPDTPATFTTEAQGPGLLIRYVNGQTPLRGLRWLPPTQEGLLPVQVMTQNDRQRFLLFQNGTLVADLVVPRPSGVREGFFNFAELREAIVIPGDVAILLYRPADASTGELPLIIALELSTRTTRWVHRAPGEHLALGRDAKEAFVFTFGPGSPILRLPLALRKDESTGASPFRTGMKAIEMPEEITDLCGLLPTGPESFLATHSGGLSSYSERSGWKHWQPTAVASLRFRDFRPSVAGSARGYWWQPFPGVITQVKADGTPIATHDSGALTPSEPWERDGMLMSLLGSDPFGNLWFRLATPSESSPIAAPTEPPPSTPEGQEANGGPETTARLETPETKSAPISSENWTSYAAEGRERIYRWNPEHGSPIGITLTDFWTALPLPQGVNRPSGLPSFHPESGQLLLESGPSAWLLPLGNLPFKSSGQAGKKTQAR